MVAWNDIVLPKEEGGLGLRDFRTWNSTLLAKYIWDIHSRRDSLWIRWIDHVYLAQRSFWVVQPKKEMSALFRRLLVIRDGLITRTGSIDGAIDWLQGCTTDGDMIVSRAYHSLRPKANPQPWFKTVWSALIPPFVYGSLSEADFRRWTDYVFSTLIHCVPFVDPRRSLAVIYSFDVLTHEPFG